jgi:orotidine-5'-phosphate decarboxylase
MATVHALGGRAMLDAAVVAAGGELDLIGVTVLTSFDAAGYARAIGRTDVALAQEVERLAVAAAESGLRGVVCSAKEVSLLRHRLGPEPFLVVPGIRGRSDPASDQSRVATARDAAESGATHLVVGRPVLQAADPAAAVDALLKEAQCVRS